MSSSDSGVWQRRIETVFAAFWKRHGFDELAQIAFLPADDDSSFEEGLVVVFKRQSNDQVFAVITVAKGRDETSPSQDIVNKHYGQVANFLSKLEIPLPESLYSWRGDWTTGGDDGKYLMPHAQD